MPAPWEPADNDYPVARTINVEPVAAPVGYASTTTAPHEVGDVGYPEATTPALEA